MRTRTPLLGQGPFWLALWSIHWGAIATSVGAQAEARVLEQFDQKVAPGVLQREPLVDARFQDPEVYLFVPRHEPQGSYPLVVLLHGNNQPPQSFLRHVRLLSETDAPVFVLAPRYQRQAGGRLETVDAPLGLFDAALAQTLDRYPIDPARVVLMGFSRGSGYAQRWLDARAAGGEGPLPFCEVWSCGGAACPQHATPGVPHLLFVGEQETAVLGHLDIRSGVRETFAAMIARGFDATYLEVPGMDHRVDPRCLELMRGRLRAFDPWPRVADADDLAVLPHAAEAIARQRIGEAFDAVDAVLDGGPTELKGAARRVRRALRAFADDRAQALGDRDTLAAHDALADLVRGLEGHPREARAATKALESLAERPVVARELRARAAYREACAHADPAALRAALVALAEEPELATTGFGQRAQSHLQALGLAYTSPQIPAPDAGKDRSP